MIKRNRSKIYSQFEINVIDFYASMIFFLPIISVFAYLFEFDLILNVNIFMFWCLITNFAVMFLGSVYLMIQRDYFKRKVKATYRSEFFYLVFIVVFGLLGFIVVYQYLGGNLQYLANILVVLFAFLLYLLIYLGNKYFKFNYMRKN